MKNNKHVYLLTAVLMSAGMAICQVSAAPTQTAANVGAGAPVNEPTSVATRTTAHSGGEAKLDGATALVAEFTQSLNSKNVKPGETVKAKVTQDVIAHGKVLVRRDSKLIGHVTEAKASSKDAPGSRLGIVFDKVALKGGGALEFHGLIEAIAAPLPSPGPGPDPMGSPTMSVANSGSGLQPLGAGSSSTTRGSSGSSTSTNSPGATSVNNTAGRQTLASPLNGSAPAVTPGGALSSGAHGVFGIPGLRLLHGPSGGVNASVVTSMRDNVKLETGTQIVIQVEDTH